MYPRLVYHMDKLHQNLDAVSAMTHGGGCSMMIVTKVACADPQLVDLAISHPGVNYLADSRVKNIATYAGKVRVAGKKTVLLRLPMLCEVEDVVKYVDLSFNSELLTIKALNEAAEKAGVVHNVLLMIDLGDLREGIFYQNEDQIFKTVEEILKLKNIKLYGVGVNLTCYGAIIPKYDNLSNLCAIAEKIEETFGIELEMVSGGNSSSIYLLGNNDALAERQLPAGINNLRLGESFVLGNDTAYETKIPGTVSDTVTLEAQIIELKTKPSLPIGEPGVDAFGQKPVYEDRGIIQRAIVAIGKQDVEPGSMTPIDPDIEILGASSDHLIVDVTKSKTEYKVGDVLEFTLGYGGLLKATTSAYVEKAYK